MFTRKCLIAAAMAATAFAAPAGAAPASAVKAADGKALLLVPLKLTKIDDLDFGTIVTSNAAGPSCSIPIRATAPSLAGSPESPSAAGHRAYFGGAGTPSQQVVVVVVPPLAADQLQWRQASRSSR